MAVKLLITDFDGTLVDTFEANYQAYRQAFRELGMSLSEEDYQRCFGFRFDRFMEAMNIHEEAVRMDIKIRKAACYPEHFDRLRVNSVLLDFLRSFRRAGGKTAIASTARRVNLMNVLDHIGAAHDFDLILTGENVAEGKPSPEIYLSVLESLNIDPSDALVFEDSEVGFKAADAAGIQYIAINRTFF